MINRVFQVCALVWLGLCPAGSLNAALRAELQEVLGPTVDRYLSSSPSYRSGDLITRSHVEELQGYLRKTQGHSAATHGKWRQRMLADNASLVKIFYSGGEEVLREAATKLGSYAELDRLARSGTGRDQLREAVKLKSSELLVRQIMAERAERAAKASEEKVQKVAASSIKARIYTADEFLAAVLGSLQVETPAVVE